MSPDPNPMSAFVPFPIDDTCRACGTQISWMFGGLFWLHRTNPDPGHDAEPTVRTDLKPFTGCTLHRDQPRPELCDTCKHTAADTHRTP